MEKFTNKKESPTNRVVGFRDEEGILSAQKRSFENQRPYKDEEIKDVETKEIIRSINEFMPDFVGRYGGKCANIEEKHIHIYLLSKIPESEREKWRNWPAVYRPLSSEIVYVHPRDVLNEGRLRLAFDIVHEMLHLNSFQSIEPEKSPGKKRMIEMIYDESGEKTFFKGRRVGFSIYSFKEEKEKSYFRDIDEAIITELELRFCKEYFPQIPILAAEIKKENISLDSFDEYEGAYFVERKKLNSFLASILDKNLKTFVGEIRKKLYRFLGGVYSKNQDSFSSTEEVFNVFARAVLTGRLLPVARLIEKTYGEGSFRRVGEKTAKVQNNNKEPKK